MFGIQNSDDDNLGSTFVKFSCVGVGLIKYHKRAKYSKINIELMILPLNILKKKLI